MSTTVKEISNREELRDHIHKIHDFLRNRGVGIGMTALKIFNLFYALKLIDTKRHTFKPMLSDTCSWKCLRSIEDPETLLSVIVGSGNNKKKNVLDELWGNTSTKDSIFYDIPKDVRADTYYKLLKKVDKIPISESYDVDLAGKIYEYFIGYGDKTSMSELGAYFTDRHITTFIINEIQPKIVFDSENEDIGHIPTMIDPFGGSGGFTLTYTKYMKEQYGSYIDWKEEIKNIYHYDLSEDVVKSASLEMFVLTGVFPTVGSNGNFKRINSFEKGYDYKYDYIITNPPYGGDKNIKNTEQIGIEKIIAKIKSDYIDEEWSDEQLKQLNERKKKIIEKSQKDCVNIRSCSSELLHFAKQFGEDNKGYPTINANDKEACSLLLFMHIVAKDGTVVGVLKEGVFFDSKYSELRKALIENFNVEQVISVPCNQFEHTTTKTSIIIFRNNGQTNKVVFSELKVNKYEKDEYEILDNKLMLVHCKDTIKENNGVEKKYICDATFDEICAPTIVKDKKGEEIEKYYYSLDPKKYNVVKKECSDKYKLVKLGDICEIKYGDRVTKKKDGVEKETLSSCPVYGGGDITFYTGREPNRKGETIVVSRFGISETCVRLIKGDIFLNDSSLSIHCDNKHIEKFIGTYLMNNTKIVFGCGNASAQKNLDVSLFKGLLIPIPHTDELLNEWVNKVSKSYDAIQKKKKELIKLEEDMKIEVKRIGDEEQCDMTTLREIVEIISGKKKVMENIINIPDGKYPLVSASHSVNIYTNAYDYDKRSLIINTINGSGNGMIHMFSKFNVTSNTLIFRSSDDLINHVIYYFLKENMRMVDNCFNGSTKKKLDRHILFEIKIPIPKNKNLIKALEPKFNQIEELHKEIKTHETEYQQVLKELEEDIKPKEITEGKYDSLQFNSNKSDTCEDDIQHIKISKKSKPENKQSTKVNNPIKVMRSTKVQKNIAI